MRNFLKSNKLDNVLYDVRGPVVDEALRMEEEGMQIPSPDYPFVDSLCQPCWQQGGALHL